MKKGFRVLLMIGLVSSVAFTACEKEEEDPTPTQTDTSAVLVEKTGGIIYNLQGPNLGAWDLVNDAAVGAAGSATIKDLIDMSSVDSTGVVFPKKWTTSTGTTFVKADASFDYANVTENKAHAAFDAGTSASSTGVLAAGDIYIAHNDTRFEHGVTVIKIVAVNETTNNNLDNITFVYKK